MADKKRVKTSNFSIDEKLTLLEMIDAKKGIIENKRTDSGINKQKKEAWDIVLEKFNHQYPEKGRKVESLKELYKNMKRHASKIMASQRLDRVATGGDPHTKLTEETSVILEKIKGIMNSVSLEVFENKFDTDHIKIEPIETTDFFTIDATLSGGEETKLACEGEATERVNDWGHYTPAKLKAPVSSVLKRRRPVKDVLAQTALRHAREIHEIDLQIKKEQLLYWQEKRLYLKKKNEPLGEKKT